MNSRAGVLSTAAIGLVCLTAAASAAAAPPSRTPCVAGEARPACHFWTGTVEKVNDGDTVTVDVDRDGTAEPATVRLTGVQAMELTRYGKRRGRSGECHGVDATERLETLVSASGNRVRLSALDPASTTGERARLRRHVAVMHEGGWVDAGALLLHEGLALWLPNDVEWAWNGRYSRLAEDAAAREVGIWDGRSCGTDRIGPAANALRLKVKWNASGNDTENVNGEWVRITNTDPLHPLSLDGWWLRDSHLRRYTFPAGAVVAAGRSIRLRVGSGTDDGASYHWGLATPAFDNATSDRRQIGDGGYLFDPRGNLRAHVQYPCRTGCAEPLAGRVHVEAHYYAPEYIRVRNVSNRPVSLFEYEIERAGSFYEFGRESILLPRQQLDLYVERPRGPVGGLARHWGQRAPRLADDGGAVTLRNALGAPVVCDAWGGDRCPEI